MELVFLLFRWFWCSLFVSYSNSFVLYGRGGYSQAVSLDRSLPMSRRCKMTLSPFFFILKICENVICCLLVFVTLPALI